ncbi:hypothetical protein CBG46_05690 [Actinobacillus succinogenes]|nr:hypothetical protein CBG46_05690 [Actinobacillus succinogenes]
MVFKSIATFPFFDSLTIHLIGCKNGFKIAVSLPYLTDLWILKFIFFNRTLIQMTVNKKG